MLSVHVLVHLFWQKWNVHFMCRFPLDLFYSFPFIYTNRLSSEFSFLNLTLFKTDYWMNLWTHHWTYWEMLMAEWIKSIYWWKHSVFIDRVSILYNSCITMMYMYSLLLAVLDLHVHVLTSGKVLNPDFCYTYTLLLLHICMTVNYQGNT